MGRSGSVVVIGALLQDPRVEKQDDGDDTCTLEIEVQRSRGRLDGDPRCEVRMHGLRAARLADILHKGSIVAVYGQLVLEVWAVGDQQQTKTWVSANRVRLLVSSAEQSVEDTLDPTRL